jgi:tRNA threonylcarbamoyl adenosine modification protein YjeE
VSAVRTFASAGPADTRAVAAALAARCRAHLGARGPDAHVFIALAGDLGAGKTTFVQGFVGALDRAVARDVTSPTYALVHRYPTEPQVTHLDLYRLDDLAGLEAIGYRDLYHGAGITLAEWADRVPEALPRARLEVRLEPGRSADDRAVALAALDPSLVPLVEGLNP